MKFVSLHILTNCTVFQNVPNESWEITFINDHYDFADTYPAVVSFNKFFLKSLIVPGSLFRVELSILMRLSANIDISSSPVLSYLSPITTNISTYALHCPECRLSNRFFPWISLGDVRCILVASKENYIHCLEDLTFSEFYYKYL